MKTFTTTTLVLLLTSLSAARLVPRAQNLQPFTGDLGGAATPVLDSGDVKRPFAVKGDTFVNIGAALQRSCDQQFNACANQANAGSADISSADCTTQKDQCTSADAGVSA